MNFLSKQNCLPLVIAVILLFAISSVPNAGSERRRSRKHSRVQQPASESGARASSEEDSEENDLEMEEEEEEESATDHPDDALRFRRLQLQDEKGFVPYDGLQKARAHVELMKAAQKERAKTRKSVGIESSGIKPESWSWIGPGNIGGRIRTIVISPANANNMWVGSVGGGIWRSIDAGNSWQPVNDFLANLSVSTIVINPANANIMYAGTGESFAVGFASPNQGFSPDGLQGAGVFKSTDAGQSWNQLVSTNPSTPAPAGCGGSANCPWFYVNRLAISPNGNTILAATWNGILRSTDAGATWSPTNSNGNWMDVDFHPTNNQRAITGTGGLAGFSTDGGLTWKNANFNQPISGRIELAYAPGSPTILYASVNVNGGEIYRSTDGESTNGAQNYTRVSTGANYLGAQGNYDNAIWVNPQDPTMVIVGGIDLWRTTNSGGSLTQISQWQSAPGSSAHADHHVIVSHPGFNNTSNRIVYFGNDGGLYRANDGATVQQTAGWTNLNNGLGITQFYSAAGSPQSGVIIGGAQDNGNVKFTGSAGSWSGIQGLGGDGGFCAADPTDSNYFYGEYVYLQLRRSNNAGVSGGDIYFGITDATNAATANFIAPFVLDPNEPNTMLAGGLSLWRSTDVKSFIPSPTWTAVPKPNPGSSLISAIAISPSTSTFVAVGHNNGDIFLSFNGTDASPGWAKIDTANLPNRFVTRLTIDSTRVPSWIYATFGGFSANNVYRTTDFGSSWTDMTGTGSSALPNVPVRSLVYHPHNPDLLYVGTEIGIFTSDDGGLNWEPMQNGPANVSVDELFWLGPDLIAATHGRGLYRASGGVYVDCNHHGLEIGTFDLPFSTLTAAINASPTYRTIWIKPCVYFEPAFINKRLEFRSLGSGPVIVLKP